jgi:hypothetical protein
MGKVLTHMAMSLDGFIADPDDNPGELFDWYVDGDVPVDSHNEGIDFSVDAASADVLRELIDGVGALVAGRRLSSGGSTGRRGHPPGPRRCRAVAPHDVRRLRRSRRRTRP